MIKESRHTLKFSNKSKIEQLDRLFIDYKIDLQNLIDLIWNDKLELVKLLSTKKIPKNIIQYSRYRVVLYKQASEIVRSVLNVKKNKGKSKKDLTKPEVDNLSIILNENLVDFEKGSKEFDEFVRVRLPYCNFGRKWVETIKLPVKYHKQSLKYKDWTRKKSAKLTKSKGIYYISLFYEKELPKQKPLGKAVGFDCGYKKLLVDNEGNIYGKDLEKIYTKICRRKPKSKGIIRAIKHRNNRINEVINSIDLKGVNKVVVEELKDVKKGSKGKFSKKFNNKLSRWSYVKTLVKLERVCQETGIELVRVSPAYTSQTCSKCGVIDKKSRSGENFKCVTCGYEVDADKNASINILHRGAYSAST